MIRSPVLVLLALSGLSGLSMGCPSETGEPITTLHLDNFAASLQAAQQRMHVRYGAARDMQLSIARSDLDRARSNAAAIAELDEPDAQPAWRPYVDAIRDAARQVVISGDVVAAAHMTGVLGARCAQCHVAINARVTFADVPQPATDPKLGPQMVGHQWAAMRMWEGLIGPSNDRWMIGARALTTVPLNVIAAAATPTFTGDVDDVARVRLQARRALAATTDDARADVFGDLLATCAHCHAILRDR